MQQELRVEKLIRWFIRASLAHAEAIEEMNEWHAASQVEELNRFFAALKRDDGVPRLLELLDHPEAAVSGMAAVYAMREEPDRCCRQLAKLAQKPGTIGFRAGAALKRWEAGEWSL